MNIHPKRWINDIISRRFSFPDKMHTPRTDKKRDGKKLIKIYQLWKSQLLFSRAEHVGERVFNVSPASTVVSQITSDEMYQERGKLQCNTDSKLIEIFCSRSSQLKVTLIQRLSSMVIPINLPFAHLTEAIGLVVKIFSWYYLS